jgi:riboflavin kinase/FMN adenylyltransferase
MEYVTTISRNEPIAITIGNFDGVHRGHLHLMHELRTAARQLHSKPVLITFSPHTLLVVRPGIDLHFLTTLEEKLALAKMYGRVVDNIVITFTPAVAAMSATEFMNFLASHFHLKVIVVGANFSLGHNRMGDIAFLEKYGQQHGIAVQTLPLAEAERTRISSTRIRALVGEGQIGEANEMLGHSLTLCGVVEHGDERGRLLGFPTANLLPEAHKLLPANGVYAVRVRLADIEAVASDASDSSPVYNGVANIGVRPTFDGKKRIVEVHLLDIQPDLYDKRITIEFIARLRDEHRFASVEELKSQILSDVQYARQILNVGG